MLRNLQRYDWPIKAFDQFMDDVRTVTIPEDGTTIERSRIVTEKFKVKHMENGEVRLIPYTEDKQDD